MTSLRNAPVQIDVYDDVFTREYIEIIKVIDTDHMIIVLKGGIDIEATINK